MDEPPSIPLPLGRDRRDDLSPYLRDARPEAIYAHVPFCRHKCHYCDFYSLVDQRDRQPAFVDRLRREADRSSELARLDDVRTIFVGGGTPTLLEPPLLARALRSIRSLATGSLEEFTVEANPETVTAEVARVLKDAGVDRVSMGCQSFHPEHLKTLERWHDPASVPVAVHHLREAGIDRVSLDLIFGIPGSTLEDWLDDLETALALDPAHLSCYGLVFEPGTPLVEKRRLGKIAPIDEDLEAEMFEATRQRLAAAGFEQYEISNWAKPGERCRHNLVYWRNGDWLGLGPAAAGHLQGVRYRQVPRLEEWLESAPPAPVVDLERSDPSVQRGERWMMGLRLRDGIPRNAVEGLLEDDPARKVVVERHLQAGRLEWRDDHLRISDEALVVTDVVVSDLVVPDRVVTDQTLNR